MQEINVGEVIEVQGKQYMAMESGQWGCIFCSFEPICQRGNKKLVGYKNYHLYCMAKFRLDRKSIYFKQIR